MKRTAAQLTPDTSSLPARDEANGGKLRRVDDGDSSKVNSRKFQSVLPFLSTKDHWQTKTCLACGMSFYKYISKDQELHEKYHKQYVHGLSWVTGSSNRTLLEQTILPKKQKGAHLNRNKAVVKIIDINRHLESQVRKVHKVLKMVNLELNAAEGSTDWSRPQDTTNIRANAFVALIDNKVVGIVTTEPITDPERQARWMVFKTQTIVPNQVNHRAKLGISRIWVAPVWRRYRIAQRLLAVTLDNSIYGVSMNKRDIAFSQPSTSGGALAKSFNGVVHKSGETLLLVYLE